MSTIRRVTRFHLHGSEVPQVGDTVTLLRFHDTTPASGEGITGAYRSRGWTLDAPRAVEPESWSSGGVTLYPSGTFTLRALRPHDAAYVECDPEHLYYVATLEEK